MRYIPVSCEQREEMLRAVGVGSVEDLFGDIPESVRLREPLDLPPGVSEMEAAAALRRLADANSPATRLVSFAGAGCYDHYIPAIVDHVLSRPEFFTAYTPYQPEVSQGTLQNIYEFQTMVCELTGMDVANASMYDGATAFTEAALMAARITRRTRVLVSSAVHPEWLATLETYASTGVLSCERVKADAGATALADLERLLSEGDEVAAVLCAAPTFFGCLEELERIAGLAHKAGALLIVATDPILAGVLEPPAVYGADIVVGEAQVLGSPMSFGGPGLGLFACRAEYLRSMPGRIVGRTVDADGDDGFVLTIQTREQHIRRERATSNICSNHALNALAASVYLSAVGVAGLESVGRSCVSKAHALRAGLLETGRFSAPWDTPFALEFALAFDGDVERMQAVMLDHGYLAGVSLDQVAPGLAPAGTVLFAVTERRTDEEIGSFLKEVRAL